MPFVKLDCAMLDSSLWIDREAREIFVTALLMAEPHQILEPVDQLKIRSLEKTGFSVPSGWYGFVRAAGVGIASRAGMDEKSALSALERLGAPDSQSRSPEFDGRRMVRVSGGFLLLNFYKYRDRDYTASKRQKAWRERNDCVTALLRYDDTDKHNVTRKITQAEAEAEVIQQQQQELLSKKNLGIGQKQILELYQAYPRKEAKIDAIKAIQKALTLKPFEFLLEAVKEYATARDGDNPQFTPLPATWFNGHRWDDDRTRWHVWKKGSALEKPASKVRKKIWRLSVPEEAVWRMVSEEQIVKIRLKEKRTTPEEIDAYEIVAMAKHAENDRKNAIAAANYKHEQEKNHVNGSHSNGTELQSIAGAAEPPNNGYTKTGRPIPI